jgi:hypothetical protein
LTDEQVRAFRVRAAQGEFLGELCREFGLSRNAGDKLVAGHRRAEVGGTLRHEWPTMVRRACPREDFWSPDEDAMAMSLPAKVVAEKTGRTEDAVWARKRRLRRAAARG